MRAQQAAEYVGEKSTASFRRSVGKLWPRGIWVPGKGLRWTREMLDEAINRLSGGPKPVRDAADVL
jgi:hypothetical protein